jgi:hypothetical protein
MATIFNNPFQGKMYADAVIAAYKKSPSLAPLVHVESAPQGVDSVVLKFAGGLVAAKKTIGGGTPLTPQASTSFTKTAILDQAPSVYRIIDDLADYQDNPDAMFDYVEQATQACLAMLNADILALLHSMAVPAGHTITTGTPVAPTDHAAIAREMERLVTLAAAQLDSSLGQGVGRRETLLHSQLFRVLLDGSTKQVAPGEVNPLGLAYVQSSPIPFQSAPWYNCGATYSAVDGYSGDTTYEFYHMTPEAVGLGMQLLLRTWTAESPAYTGYEVASAMVYGLVEGLSKALVKCQLVLAT